MVERMPIMKSVMIFGTFDGVHEGHRELFRQAKCYGDFLIAVVARQSTVFTVKKRLPKYSERVRYTMLLLEPLIDKVFLGDREDVYRVVKQVNPDVICLGYDQEYFVRGLDGVFFGKIIRLSPFHPELYKSSKIDREEDVVGRVKKRLRECLLEKRKAIPAEKRIRDSEKIQEKVLIFPEVKNSGCIALYRSMGSEVMTQKLFERLLQIGKTVVVPGMTAEKQIVFFQIFPETQFTKEKTGFPLPIHAPFYFGKVDICIVPCVGFDVTGYRLGWGKGYYDRLLEMFPNMFSMGVAFEEQGIECLPIESHDKGLSAIVTLENGLPVIKRYDILCSEKIRRSSHSHPF